MPACKSSAHRMMLRIPPLNSVAYPFEVGPHALDRERLVTLLQRFEDREMLLVVARARAEDAEDQALFFREQILQDVAELCEYRVA